MGILIDVLSYKVWGEATLLDLLIVAVLMFFALIIASMVRSTLRRSLKHVYPPSTLSVLEKITYYGILSIAFLAALTQLGVNFTGLVIAGGFLGIIIGFASQTVVSNLISGIFLFIDKPFKIGEAVDIGGVSGVVTDISIFSTKIRTWDGIYVRLANEKVFSSEIHNFHAHVVRRFSYIVGIRYADDADKAIEIIKKVIEEHPLALAEPEPVVFVDELADNSVNIRVNIWAPSKQWYTVKMELLWKIKRALEEEGIQIPFPQRVIWYGKENPKGDSDSPDA
ncbi:MAG: mechanosensitive ion channel family protein [Candidatus Hydrothermarchaeota archaeon]